MSQNQPSGKNPSEPIQSRKQAQAVLVEMRKLDADLQEAIGRRDKLTAEHLCKLKLPAGLDETIASLETRLLQSTERLQAWAIENREKEFAGKQSTELAQGGELKFRVGNRKLDLLAGWTWGKCLKAMQKVKFWRRYIRMKPELNKEQLLADSSNNADMENPKPPKVAPARLRKIGLRVWREETFTVEIKPGTLYSTTSGCQS